MKKLVLISLLILSTVLQTFSQGDFILKNYDLEKNKRPPKIKFNKRITIEGYDNENIKGRIIGIHSDSMLQLARKKDTLEVNVNYIEFLYVNRLWRQTLIVTEFIYYVTPLVIYLITKDEDLLNVIIFNNTNYILWDNYLMIKAYSTYRMEYYKIDKE